MATLSTLTPAQKKSLADFDAILRPTVIALVKVMAQANAVVTQYNATILPILSLLDGTEDLPNPQGLAGSVPFTKADPGFLVSYIQAMRDNYNTNLNTATHQALYVKAAGAINLT